MQNSNQNERCEWVSRYYLGKQRHGPTGTVKVEFEEFTQNSKI